MGKPIASLPPSRSATNPTLHSNAVVGKPATSRALSSKKCLPSTSGGIHKAKAKSSIMGHPSNIGGVNSSSSCSMNARKASTFPRPSTSSGLTFMTQDRLLKGKSEGEGGGGGGGGGGGRPFSAEHSRTETKRVIRKAIDEAIHDSLNAHRQHLASGGGVVAGGGLKRRMSSMPMSGGTARPSNLSTPTTKVFSAVNRMRTT